MSSFFNGGRKPFAVASGALALVVASTALGYKPHEHRILVDAGARASLAQLAKLAPLPWRNTRGQTLVDKQGRLRAGGGAGAWTTLGELAAIYGDMRTDEAALAKTTPARVKLLAQFARASKVTPAFALQEGVRQLELLSLNKTHFSSIAAATYFDVHARALEHAAAAGSTGDRSRLWSALHAEALALHSLTDLFAPGHLFVDRREHVANVLNGRRKLSGVLRNPLQALKGFASLAKGLWGGRETQVIHDRLNKVGVEVKHARGEAWLAYGDKDRHRQTRAASRIAERAVAESLDSLRRIFELARERAKDKAGARSFADLARSGAYHGALQNVPTHFRNAKFDGDTLCNQAEHCALLLNTTIPLLLAGKRSDVDRVADAESARMAALAQVLDPNKADSVLKPGDVLLMRAEGRPSVVQRVIKGTQSILKRLFGGKDNKALAAGATTVTHALIYVGGGLVADAAERGVHVRRLAEVKGHVLFEAYRPQDQVLASRAVEIARAWGNGRMGYLLPILIPFGNSYFGPNAKKEAMSYARATKRKGGPAGHKRMFCTQFVLALYQAAFIERLLVKNPRLSAKELALPVPYDRHASRMSTTTFNGKLGEATKNGTWRVVGWFETRRK